MHVANCEYLLLSISCKMNADQSLFGVDLNERRGDRTYLIWSIITIYTLNLFLKKGKLLHCQNYKSVKTFDFHLIFISLR